MRSWSSDVKKLIFLYEILHCDVTSSCNELPLTPFGHVHRKRPILVMK